MRILKGKKPGFYKVESLSRKGKFYGVDIKKPFCDCPDFMFREMKQHGICKHIRLAREFAEKANAKKEKKVTQDFDRIIAYVRKKGEADSIGLIKKFGEKTIDEMIKRGELIEKKGNMRILS